MIEKLKPGAAEPGEIVHLDGRVLGRHQGIIHYTIGQRRGIGVATGEPLYVVQLDAGTGRVIVGPRSALATSAVYLRDVNWIGDGTLAELPAGGIEIHAKVRSTRPPRPAVLRVELTGIIIELPDGETGVAPGQACVFYDGDGLGARVLGGGWIDRTRRASVSDPKPGATTVLRTVQTVAAE